MTNGVYMLTLSDPLVQSVHDITTYRQRVKFHVIYLRGAMLGAAVPGENRAKNSPLLKSSINLFIS